ncbi:MAG: DUF4157 domain-containing protein [Pseudomonadota bacterium]|nr:DUF4157 domain-containing protein [Pseudomonadota bacterium]
MDESAPLLQRRPDQAGFQPERNEPGINAREQEARPLADHLQIPGQKSAVPSWDFGKISIFPPSPQPSLNPLGLQPKLAIGAINDPIEHEADRIADQVMRMPDPDLSIAATPAQLSRKCAACAKEEKTQTVQTKPAGSAESTASEAPPIVHKVLSSPGQPLDMATRAFMEPRFGHDFSHVRVHTDTKAEESARAVNALAYTVGQNIAFGAGQYAPETAAGRRLTAHELAHTIQQSAAAHVPLRLQICSNSDAEEANPKLTATGLSNETSASMHSSGVVLQRQDDDGGLPPGGAPPAPTPPSPAPPAALRICGPDITTSITTMLGTVEPWFRGLTGFEQSRSCVALGPGAPLVGVNPIMAWDTRELFLPNTGWLDAYFRDWSCGSPRDSGCDTDPTRNLCETAGTCGNSVVVGGKCMLAGTANYALFGKMCRLCHDYTGRWSRWDMRAIIGVYKTLAGDDSTPPKEVASAAYDGTFPTVPAAAENRGTCTGLCGLTHSGAFDFIWEPYRSR